MNRPGIIDLRDLASRYAWQRLAIERFIELAGLVVEDDDRRHQFGPPRVVVVVVPSDREWMIRRARAWLDEADHVVLLRDRSEEEDATLEADPELRELVEQEWRDTLAGLSVEVIDGLTADTARKAIERAVAACEQLAHRDRDRDRDRDQDPSKARSPEPLELPSTPWSAYTTGFSSRFVFLPMLVDHLERRDQSVVLQLDGETSHAIDLTDAPPIFELSMKEARATRDSYQLRPGRTALGRDPVHPVGWRGDRMFFYWSYLARGSDNGGDNVCFLSATDHDFPCGPAKKLYGYADNDPVQVSMAPDVSLCAARFEHDVLLTSAVPIAWHRAGDVDVASFARDPRRAVLFAQNAASPAPRAEDIDLLDEDARDVAPAVVIGPDKQARYAVDLTFSVYRITALSLGTRGAAREADVTHVGGPDAGHAVFDADHGLVHRHSGRLLGGWFRWATIEDAGYYWREDLATGERTRLGPVDMSIAEDAEMESIARDAILQGRHDVALEIHQRHPSRSVGSEVHVIAIAGTRNVLLVTDRYLRVV